MIILCTSYTLCGLFIMWLIHTSLQVVVPLIKGEIEGEPFQKVGNVKSILPAVDIENSNYTVPSVLYALLFKAVPFIVEQSNATIIIISHLLAMTTFKIWIMNNEIYIYI